MTEHDERQIEMLLAENKTLNVTVKNLEESIDILVSLNKKLHEINRKESDKTYVFRRLLNSIIESQVTEPTKSYFEWKNIYVFGKGEVYKYPSDETQKKADKYHACEIIVQQYLIDNLADNVRP